MFPLNPSLAPPFTSERHCTQRTRLPWAACVCVRVCAGADSNVTAGKGLAWVHINPVSTHMHTLKPTRQHTHRCMDVVDTQTFVLFFLFLPSRARAHTNLLFHHRKVNGMTGEDTKFWRKKERGVLFMYVSPQALTWAGILKLCFPLYCAF